MKGKITVDGEVISVNDIFARQEKENFWILYSDSGLNVNSIDANIFSINEMNRALYGHSEGILLTKEDVLKLGIAIEYEAPRDRK